MTKILSILLIAASPLITKAQNTGIPYMLPKTAVKVIVLIEKTQYTPGQFAAYADKYMRLHNVGLNASQSFRIARLTISTLGIPDSTKSYVAPLDKKHCLKEVKLGNNGVLCAINTDIEARNEQPAFKAAPQPKLPQPADYMSEDILRASSHAKMAQLIAREIYDIRESKNQLSRGQAEFMPKDGEQLRIMLHNLNTQEQALTQVFEGVTAKDTIQKEVIFVPEQNCDHEVLFRFSKHYGMTDKNDLGGDPIYISVKDLNTVSTPDVSAKRNKKAENTGIFVNVPDKAEVIIADMRKNIIQKEVFLAQFGHTEALGDELFGKKQQTSLTLDVDTGALLKIKDDAEK